MKIVELWIPRSSRGMTVPRVFEKLQFRKFLEVAAQSNGKIINYSNIARDVGVEDKTVKNYFTVLEDTFYFYSEYRFSYFQTESGVEVDLIVERPGEKHLFIEIKSKENVVKEDVRSLMEIALEFGECKEIIFYLKH